MHTHITKSNVEAAIRDDKAHMTYLKEDVNKDQKYGGKYKDENQTADEKHISKLAGDVKHDEKKEGLSRRSSGSNSPLHGDGNRSAHVGTPPHYRDGLKPQEWQGHVKNSPHHESDAQEKKNLMEDRPVDKRATTK
jgi:hypothetical protein